MLLYVKEFLTKGMQDPYNIQDVRYFSVEFHMDLVPSFSERKDARLRGSVRGSALADRIRYTAMGARDPG